MCRIPQPEDSKRLSLIDTPDACGRVTRVRDHASWDVPGGGYSRLVRVNANKLKSLADISSESSSVGKTVAVFIPTASVRFHQRSGGLEVTLVILYSFNQYGTLNARPGDCSLHVPLTFSILTLVGREAQTVTAKSVKEALWLQLHYRLPSSAELRHT